MAYCTLAGFIYFILGLLYMDMRIDHKLLLYEPTQQHIRLSFIHYDIESMQYEVYGYILPILIVIALIAMIRRVITFCTIYDWMVIIMATIMLALFVLIKQDQQYIHARATIKYPKF